MTWSRFFTGGMSGLLATWPMTAAMVVLRDRVPAEWLTSLPPRRITLRAAGKAGLLPHLGWRQREAFTWISHFGFGAAAGAIFGWLKGPRDAASAEGPGGPRGVRAARRAPPEAMVGAAYGFAVWAAAYLGLMPALGLHPVATRERAARNRLMILSHLVWGASLALCHGFLRAALARTRNRTATGSVHRPGDAPRAASRPGEGLPIGHTAAWESRVGSPAFD